MKKRLNIHCKGNEGFFLPYVIFISMLVFLNVTILLATYENKANETKTMNEFVEIETLIQMTKASFVNDKVYESSEMGNVKYEHPNGEVNLVFKWLDSKTVQARTIVTTLKGSTIQRGFRLYFTESKFKKDVAE